MPDATPGTATEVEPSPHLVGCMSVRRREHPMSNESPERGAAEERADVPQSEDEHSQPASPSSTPGGDSHARGFAEEAADTPETE